LELTRISSLWRTVANSSSNNKDDDEENDEDLCPFRWTAGLQKEKNLSELEDHSHQAFLPYLETPTTWQLIQNDFGKGRIGWAHYEAYVNSSVQEQPLRFHFPFEGIQTVALFVAKSIDPDWANSTALLTVRNDRDEIVKSKHIQGYHFSPDHSVPPKRPKKRQIKLRMTRQVYLEEVDISGVLSNSTSNLNLQLEHLSGVGFKFMGMALCRFPSAMDGVSTLINNW
jgi:hypothetical protein